MTPAERDAIDRWFDICQATMPEGTLMYLLYRRDGLVHLGRGGTAYEAKDFLYEDLPIATELIVKAMQKDEEAEHGGGGDAPTGGD